MQRLLLAAGAIVSLALAPLAVAQTAPAVPALDDAVKPIRISGLGIRVSETTCRLLAKVGSAWLELGPERCLPIAVPSTPTELLAARDDLIALMAWQYEHEHPWTDLRQTLNAGWRPP